MSSLQLLNRLSKARSGYTSFDSLELNVHHNIRNFEKQENKNNNWGSRVRVNLDDGRYLILPTRFNDLLKNDQYKKMSKEKYCLIYRGKQNSYAVIEFKPRKRIGSIVANMLKNVSEEEEEETIPETQNDETQSIFD